MNWILNYLSNFPGSSVGKESACNAGGPGSITESGNSAGEGIGYPLQYSWASLVAPLVKNPPAMSETWVWSLVGTIPWRREKLPTPVFWPGEFHGLCSPWSHKESDTTERLSLSNYFISLNFSFVIFKYNIINWRFLISFKKTVAFKQEFPLTNGLFLWFLGIRALV